MAGPSWKTHIDRTAPGFRTFSDSETGETYTPVSGRPAAQQVHTAPSPTADSTLRTPTAVTALRTRTTSYATSLAANDCTNLRWLPDEVFLTLIAGMTTKDCAEAYDVNDKSVTNRIQLALRRLSEDKDIPLLELQEQLKQFRHDNGVGNRPPRKTALLNLKYADFLEAIKTTSTQDIEVRFGATYKEIENKTTKTVSREAKSRGVDEAVVRAEIWAAKEANGVDLRYRRPSSELQQQIGADVGSDDEVAGPDDGSELEDETPLDDLNEIVAQAQN